MAIRPRQILVSMSALVIMVSSPAGAQTALSSAQQKVVTTMTAKLSAEERKMIAEWSDAVKLAEFICKPAVLAELKKVDKAADKVFLGPDDEGRKQMKLEGNTKLTGRGSVRLVGDWKDFAFTCTLNPTTATATATATVDK